MEIEISKRKIYLVIAGCIVFTFICLDFIIFPAKFSTHALRSAWLVRSFGIIGLFFLFVGYCRVLNRLRHGQVALKVDKNGIFEPSLSNIYIKWEDISDITKKSVYSSNYLIINVINPDFYMKQSLNKTALNIMSSNMKIYKTPIVLSANYMKCNFKELEYLIISEFKNQKDK